MPNTAQYDLANISLHWMIEGLLHSECKILFCYEYFTWRKISIIIEQDQPLSSLLGVPLNPSANEDVDVLNA